MTKDLHESCFSKFLSGFVNLGKKDRFLFLLFQFMFVYVFLQLVK